jgi:hypothetical protein
MTGTLARRVGTLAFVVAAAGAAVLAGGLGGSAAPGYADRGPSRIVTATGPGVPSFGEAGVVDAGIATRSVQGL